jgi:hypothetical protein
MSVALVQAFAPESASATDVGTDLYARQRAAVQVLARPELLPLSRTVGDVVLVLSSSRSGSSLLMNLLGRHTGCLALQGECNPFLRVAGLAFPESGATSDALDSSALLPWKRSLLERAITCELAGPTPGGFPPAASIWWRLTLQWPDTNFDFGETAFWVQQAWAAARTGTDRLRGAGSYAFPLALLQFVRRAHREVDPFRYDLPDAVLRRVFPVRSAGGGSEPGRIVEEPPFVPPTLRRPCSRSELSNRPLVLKGPSDGYRVPFWSSLFQGVRLRVIHLTRNPAAAINGLYDGWRFDGFHSHRLPGDPLRIAGYSHLPGGRSWWKFDLPPSWESVAQEPLERVCGFQWLTAHGMILEAVSAHGLTSDPDRYLRLPYEALNVPGPGRRRTLQRVLDWLGLARPPAGAAFWHDPPLVMATKPPSSGRWRERAALLRPVLDQPQVRRLAAELGYEDESEWS